MPFFLKSREKAYYDSSQFSVHDSRAELLEASLSKLFDVIPENFAYPGTSTETS